MKAFDMIPSAQVAPMPQKGGQLWRGRNLLRLAVGTSSRPSSEQKFERGVHDHPYSGGARRGGDRARMP